MHTYSELIIGNWYKSPENEDIFEIVAVDAKDDYIEIQYFNGEIAELDLNSWNELHIAPIATPEDWSGPYEISKEDLENYTENVIHPKNWDNPLTFIEPEDL